MDSEFANNIILTQTESLTMNNRPNTPPTFLWHTATDEVVPVDNTLLFFHALRIAGVKAELHIYPEGPHGLALSSIETAGCNGEWVRRECESWLQLAINWITYSL